MIKLYNFIASWQLFPEKGSYHSGQRPKSGTYRIYADQETKELQVFHNWVTLENQAFSTEYKVSADGEMHPLTDHNEMDSALVKIIDGTRFEIEFWQGGSLHQSTVHKILPNGHMSITSTCQGENDEPIIDKEIYHKQMSVLTYSSSVGGAVIKPTEEGVIRHKSLTAMEEQTNMQLGQIRKQIELLALQAQEIQKRKELSMMIYGAKLSFQPVIGQVYYLYEKKDDAILISMISPAEWGGGSGPFKRFIAKVRLLADHTWTEVE